MIYLVRVLYSLALSFLKNILPKNFKNKKEIDFLLKLLTTNKEKEVYERR